MRPATTAQAASIGRVPRGATAGGVFQGALLAIFVVTWIALAVAAPGFAGLDNQLNVIRQAAPILIVAVGMTMVITIAGIDLSVGSMLALSAVLSAVLLGAGWGAWLTATAITALGAATGGINGYFVAYRGIPAFIVTLASLSMLRGAAQLITQGYSIPIDPGSAFIELGRGRVAGAPVPAVVAMAIVSTAYLALTRTRFGVYVTGIGSNEEAVRRAGVDVRRVKVRVYALCGVAAAVAGMITAGRLASGSSYSGAGFELQVIAAVVVGGTNLLGGEPRLLGTVVGALLLATIGNGLILMNVSPFVVPIVEGAIILLAIGMNLALGSRWLAAAPPPSRTVA